MIRFCIGFLVGLSCLFWLENSQQSHSLLVFSLILLTSLFVFPPRYRRHRRYIGAPLSGCLWGSIAVSLWLSTTPQLLSTPHTAEIQGYICSLPVKYQSSKRLSFDFCLTEIDDHQISFYQANKLRLSYYRATNEQSAKMLAGSFWKLRAKLKPIHGRLNPGGFDYEKWLVSEGFIGSGYIKNSEMLAAKFSVKAYYQYLRQKILLKLNQVIPEGESKGMILALAIGERGSITAEQWQAIKDSGTSHLLAISGLHIGIAALWSYYFWLFIFARIKSISRKLPAQKIAEVGSLVGALSIALLSGFGYPAQRALIMLGVYLYTRWSGRHLSLANILAISVIIIAFFQPFAVLTVSFWLSILAVAIIVLLLSYKQSINGRHYGLKEWLRINWFLFVGLMPITWVVFDSISMVGFFANLLLIPLTSFITTPLVYIGLITLSVSNELSSWFFYLADKLITLTYQLQIFFAEVNQLTSVSSLPASLFILLFLATLTILMPAKMPGKTILIPLSMILLLVLTQSKKDHRFKMVVFDIGQGLAIHLTVGDKHLLYDTGYGNADFSMAATSLVPYFKREGIERLDVLVISHADADHAGGLPAIKNDLQISYLYVGEKASEQGIDCHTTPAWQWQAVKFSFLPHLSNKTHSGNNTSCVLQISIADQISGAEQKILLTGDIERKAERKLLNNGIGQFDILVAAHHGSLTSSSEEFVERIQPEYAIFSTGYANQWHFPKTEILQRYANIGANNLVTHQHGAILIHQDSDGKLRVTTERANRPHFWQMN